MTGVSTGAPGHPLGYGPPAGVFVAFSPLEEGQCPHGGLLAHELGHLLGLFHSSEGAFFEITIGQSVHDQLTDTGLNDATNLMHHDGQGTSLSESQAAILRSSPWVCH
ncbi:MAG: hypothetical protein ACI9OJ_001317 [Myxococcota bacterium]